VHIFESVTKPGSRLSTAPPYVALKIAPRSKLVILHRDQISLVPKIAAKDATLTVNNADGGRTTFPIPAGTDIALHVAGLHYNRMLCKRCIPGGQFLIESHSAVLEESSQIYARAVPG
jgi:hypothetical protein